MKVVTTLYYELALPQNYNVVKKTILCIMLLSVSVQRAEYHVKV